MPEPEHTHLGDGAYATFEGWGIWLKANHHEMPTDKVFLDPDALFNLIRFAYYMGAIEEEDHEKIRRLFK